MPNIGVSPKTRLSPFRRIALGTWHTVGDPSAYGSLTLRMDEALRYIDAFRATTGKRLTITHMVGKALGCTLAEFPEANSVLRLRNIYQRDEIAIFFQVVMEDPESGQIDLSGMTLRDPEKKSLSEIVDEFDASVARVRERRDRNLEKTRGMLSRVPVQLVAPIMKLTEFLTFDLNLDLTSLGLARDAFGSAMITNIGSLGLEEAWVPLVPWARASLLLALGSVRTEPVVDESGKLVPGHVMKIGATIDHRVLDGAHAARMARIIQKWMEHPWDHFDPIPRPPPSAAPQSAETPTTASAAETKTAPAKRTARRPRR